MKTLPTLYKKTSTGAIQMWTIGVDNNNIIVNFGQQGGKIQRTEETIKSGKNLGRSNATTPELQALSEATARWEGKVKKGYVEDATRAAAGEKDIDGGYDCMLAHKFADQGHKIKYPAATQPKLNGHRCLAIINDGVAKLYSRTRKPILSCPHIILELERLFQDGYHELDGELYNHAYKDKFEELASLIRQEVPDPNHTEIQYHVYDFPSNGDTFKVRSEELTKELNTKTPFKYIINTETIIVNDEVEMMDAFDKFLKAGYEGGMARNLDSLYVGKRSYDLQKIKEFLDADYMIVDITEGRGTYAGCGMFICQSPNVGHTVGCKCKDCTFEVKMRGPRERLREFWNDHSLWSGKTLVVKYQYVSKYGIPIFPVGERFKEDIQ